jgi:hypothetical protein
MNGLVLKGFFLNLNVISFESPFRICSATKRSPEVIFEQNFSRL